MQAVCGTLSQSDGVSRALSSSSASSSFDKIYVVQSHSATGTRYTVKQWHSVVGVKKNVKTIWDHTVFTFHPTQVNTPPAFNPSQTGRYSNYLPRRDGRLSWPRWQVTYRDGLPAHRRSPIHVLSVTAGSRTHPPVDHKSDALTIAPASHLDNINIERHKERSVPERHNWLRI